MTDTPRTFHTPTWERLDLPAGFAGCLSCNEILTVEQVGEPCKKPTPVETIRCECRDHGSRECVPIPARHVRHDIRVGPEEQGVVRLCAFCFINGHHGRAEFWWKAKVRNGQVA